jgi:thiol-disulfide isomerase/thioredoxin
MLPALLLYASLVNDVRSLIARHDLPDAERTIAAYQAQSGATPELAAAISWIARAELDGRNFPQADRYATQARTLSDTLLRTHKLDADPWLPTALGAAIEVHAQALAGEGERLRAVAYLRSQLGLFAGTSIHERIQKNLNLLDLEGKPAPRLVDGPGFGGHPVLLFFWAHWCPDCKAEVPILAGIERVYGPKGLVLIGPTRLYGYAAGGEEASPAVEKRYIESVRREYYAPLSSMQVPLSAVNFEAYGASTTPTLVLVDVNGIVRLFHPGAMTGPELVRAIESVLRR